MIDTTAEVKAFLYTDLIVQIEEGWSSSFRGSSAQLIADGLVPQYFKFPRTGSQRSWVSGRFSCTIERACPDGTNMPISTWIYADYWKLRRTVTGCEDYDSCVRKQKLNDADSIAIYNSDYHIQMAQLAKVALMCKDYVYFRSLLIGQ